MAAEIDNGCLSVSIHGILILFLCLEKQGGRGRERGRSGATGIL